MLTESGFFKEKRDGEPEAARPSSVPPNLSPHRYIAGKYELLRKIGVGAMGEVWAARHVSLDEEVAIKLVLRDVQHEDGSTADGRFLVEARVARMLSRKTRHIVSVTDHGDDGDMAYLVMELLNGESLDVRLSRSGPLPLEKVIPLVQQVARALTVAHAEGIVHRDLKPGNVFLTLDEEGKPLIKILDFGIAKLRDDEAKAATRKGPFGVMAQDSKQATMRGFLLGTPAYMSPEQAKGNPLDHRADVWALAVITYHLLTAQFPFDGANADELFQRLVRFEAFPITDHRKDLPPAISAFFERAFSRKIDERFGSVEELAKALAHAAGDRPPAKISLPPPAPHMHRAVRVATVARKEESVIVPAGVPMPGRRRHVVAALGAIALLGAVVFGYGRLAPPPPPEPVGLTAAANTAETAVATTLRRSDDLIPRPEPIPEPAASPVTKAAVPRVAAPPTAEPTPPPIVAPSIAAPPPAPVAAEPPPKKAIDKSQIF